MSGYVYVIETSNGVKIGKSIQPDKRIRTLETQGGLAIRKKFVTEKHSLYSKTEILSHDKLSEFRFIGEWFSCSFECAVETVKKYMDLKVLDEDLKLSDSNSVMDGDLMSLREYVEVKFLNNIAEFARSKGIKRQQASQMVNNGRYYVYYGNIYIKFNGG